MKIGVFTIRAVNLPVFFTTVGFPEGFPQSHRHHVKYIYIYSSPYCN